MSQTEKKNKNEGFSSYAKYSALGIQAGIIIFAGTLGGYKLDTWTTFKFPVFTILLSLISVFAAIWILIREVSKKNKTK
ncbi:MAG: AtpZ/AtpI family protein [Lentimicrobium sp.]|nr:AtpZ/AtpI family protein [Lentimicrobium sp.]